MKISLKKKLTSKLKTLKEQKKIPLKKKLKLKYETPTQLRLKILTYAFKKGKLVVSSGIKKKQVEFVYILYRFLQNAALKAKYFDVLGIPAMPSKIFAPARRIANSFAKKHKLITESGGITFLGDGLYFTLQNRYKGKNMPNISNSSSSIGSRSSSIGSRSGYSSGSRSSSIGSRSSGSRSNSSRSSGSGQKQS